MKNRPIMDFFILKKSQLKISKYLTTEIIES